MENYYVYVSRWRIIKDIPFIFLGYLFSKIGLFHNCHLNYFNFHLKLLDNKSGITGEALRGKIS